MRETIIKLLCDCLSFHNVIRFRSSTADFNCCFAYYFDVDGREERAVDYSCCCSSAGVSRKSSPCCLVVVVMINVDRPFYEYICKEINENFILGGRIRSPQLRVSGYLTPRSACSNPTIRPNLRSGHD